MGLETAPQNPLGRIDPGLVVPRIDENLNSPSATTAMVEAFRTGQISAADIADRAMKRPAVEAAVANATDPQLVEARKAQELAVSQEAVLKTQQLQDMTNLPQVVQQIQAELLPLGLAIPTPPAKWTEDDSANAVKVWTDVQNWKTNMARLKAQKEIVKGTDITDASGVVRRVPMAQDSGQKFSPAAVASAEKFFSQYQNPRAWIAAGKPEAPDIFASTAPGTALTAATAGGPDQGTVLKTGENKAPTEMQAKAGMATARFLASDEVFKNLEKAGFNPGATGNWTQELLIGPFAALRSADKRSYDAAKSAWSQGLLRLESGAAIAAKEQKWYETTFFPTGLEPKAVQDQKASMRADVETIVKKLAETGHLDVPSLLNVETRANLIHDLSTNGALTGKSLPAVNIGGRTGRMDNSDPANPKIIWDAPGTTNAVSKPYFAPGTLRSSTVKATVEPK